MRLKLKVDHFKYVNDNLQSEVDNLKERNTQLLAENRYLREKTKDNENLELTICKLNLNVEDLHKQIQFKQDKILSLKSKISSTEETLTGKIEVLNKLNHELLAKTQESTDDDTLI